jgi:hypothetical protein
MRSCTIAIPVDAQTERAWDAIRAEERRKIEVVIGLWLRELAAREPESLKAVMEEAAREAQAKGLTPAILDSLLKGA